MHKSLLVLTAAAALASCAPPAASTSTASTASSFVVGTLDTSDTAIQGCTVMLSRADAESAGYVFIEDGVDVGAKGFVRIDGAILQLDLLSSEGDDNGGVRTFAKDGTQLVETWTAGAANEASDSVGRDATLVITRGGAAQTVRVVGGVAC